MQGVELPAHLLFAPWKRLLHDLAKRTRQNLLSDLAVLMPVVIVLGDTEAVEELTFSLLDVVKWWP